MPDIALAAARASVMAAEEEPRRRPEVTAFFDPDTSAVAYVVADPHAAVCGVIDSVLGFDPVSARTNPSGLEALMAFIDARGYRVDWILETHVHADHLSGAAVLKETYGAPVGVGADIARVQAHFGPLFGRAAELGPTDFDRLFDDGDHFAIGGLEARVLATPGHTPADIAYVIGDAVFVGDALFMPDYGTARTDFPGGDPRRLYGSIRRLLALPAETRLFSGHDYKAPGRDAYAWESTVGAQRAGNVHIRDGVDEAAFVAFRMGRDATLPLPRLIWPALQVNLKGGRLPDPGAGGHRHLLLPLDAI